MTDNQVVLSMETLKALFRWENLGELHNTLYTGSSWLDEEEQQAADARAWDELTARGLAGPQGLHPGFRSWLQTIARPAVEFYGWYQTTTVSGSVLVAALDSNAVTVKREGNSVTFEQARPDALAECLVRALPEVGAAQGRSLNLPEVELTGNGRGYGDGEFTGFASTKEHPDARPFRQLMKEPRTGGGELLTARRDAAGRRAKPENGINYIDIPTGRWVFQKPDEHWVTAVPGSAQIITTKLNELQASLT
ncbi:ESX secretion-associated protein EspG [Pseudonocardiaceae bacterium YIM PH 21723]|nr:ESX secretion-associated protein EspG [Pseudonocardiaceae bacterium YIM PH 21723]